jgi:hypothetical protein
MSDPEKAHLARWTAWLRRQLRELVARTAALLVASARLMRKLWKFLVAAVAFLAALAAILTFVGVGLPLSPSHSIGTATTLPSTGVPTTATTSARPTPTPDPKPDGTSTSPSGPPSPSRSTSTPTVAPSTPSPSATVAETMSYAVNCSYLDVSGTWPFHPNAGQIDVRVDGVVIGGGPLSTAGRYDFEIPSTPPGTCHWPEANGSGATADLSAGTGQHRISVFSIWCQDPDCADNMAPVSFTR